MLILKIRVCALQMVNRSRTTLERIRDTASASRPTLHEELVLPITKTLLANANVCDFTDIFPGGKDFQTAEDPCGMWGLYPVQLKDFFPGAHYGRVAPNLEEMCTSSSAMPDCVGHVFFRLILLPPAVIEFAERAAGNSGGDDLVSDDDDDMWADGMDDVTTFSVPTLHEPYLVGGLLSPTFIEGESSKEWTKKMVQSEGKTLKLFILCHENVDFGGGRKLEKGVNEVTLPMQYFYLVQHGRWPDSPELTQQCKAEGEPEYINSNQFLWLEDWVCDYTSFKLTAQCQKVFWLRVLTCLVVVGDMGDWTEYMKHPSLIEGQTSMQTLQGKQIKVSKSVAVLFWMNTVGVLGAAFKKYPAEKSRFENFLRHLCQGIPGFKEMLKASMAPSHVWLRATFDPFSSTAEPYVNRLESQSLGQTQQDAPDNTAGASGSGASDVEMEEDASLPAAADLQPVGMVSPSARVRTLEKRKTEVSRTFISE